MAVPKRRTSSRRRDQRRANHDKVAATQYITCPNCSEVALPHRACQACGWYKGRAVVAVKATTG